MATSKVPAVLDAVKTLLQARPGLSDVNVFSGPVDPQTGGKESIELIDVDDETQEPANMGPTRSKDEYFTIHGLILASRLLNKTDTEATIKLARDRAYAILAEIETGLRANDTLDGLVVWCLLAGSSLSQRITEHGRTAFLEFDVKVRARL